MEGQSILDTNVSNSGLTISPEIKIFLKETAKWAKFLAIVGFVFIGLMIVAALFMTFAMGDLMGEAGLPGIMSGGFLGAFYLVFALLYFFPILYLYRFASKMKIALANDDQTFLQDSFQNLKSHYVFIGILMAIILAFYVVMIVVGIVAGGMAMF